MKSLTEFINESNEIYYKPTYDLDNDIYNVLSGLGFEYTMNANKKFDKKDVKKACENFINNFFE